MLQGVSKCYKCGAVTGKGRVWVKFNQQSIQLRKSYSMDSPNVD